MRPPMRSSIACLRCRKSKIKCENNGGSSPCDGCIKTGKKCEFKLPEANPTPPKRSEPPSSIKQERDGGSDRKKLKKIDEIAKGDNQKVTLYADEVLAAPFLTEDIWDQVLDLYKLHFAPELPFLHLPSMREYIGRRFRAPQPEPTDTNLVLLGVLVLTARFHSDLVKYLAHVYSSQGGNARSRPVQTQIDPAAASEYYADTLAVALGPMRTAMKVASLERVQAMLMLGLYEWGQTRPKTGGLSAWMYVGSAIRMAQFLNLGFGDNPRDSGDSKTRPSDSRQRRTSMSLSQTTLDNEVKRRTMFSCFILDRMLACGKERLSIIQPDDLQIQLPCSEDKFDLAMEANTGFLRPRNARESAATDDSVLSQFIRLVDIWGEISRYSSAGGRVKDAHPPWDPNSIFRQLRENLAAFDNNLPDTFTFSRSNYFKHENHHASSVYVLLHMLRNVSLIMLHREYIPFVPIRCAGPEGPLDKPTFPKDNARREFWLESAEQVFKAAREIVDLIEICQKKDKLPQSTIVLFAIWTAAFVGLYGAHFPHMDVQQHMLSHRWNEQSGDAEGDVFQHGPTGLAYQTLNKISYWLKMASTYVGVLQNMDIYFDKIKQDFDRHVDKNKSLSEKMPLSLRLGGRGGALEEYQQMSKQLKDFGTLHPDDPTHMDSSDRSRASTMERASSVGADSHNASVIERVRTPRSTPSASFVAINHGLPDPSVYSDRTAGPSGNHSEVHTDHWRGQQNPMRPHQSPIQGYAVSHPPGTMLDPATAAAQAALQVGYSQQQSQSHQPQSHQPPPHLQFELDHEESKRFGDTNDLGILTQNDPWLDLFPPDMQHMQQFVQEFQYSG
ncbi:fungal-specific transcription factor domain-containing protein [Pseudomassariella vexata]|uniref:Fungal-specific transcription factor domain-domain-containing protein n=1 Tax=Pseudomassariella vexata TaxID=1141098 RepID=A0A1Y2DVA5_9PEZI|nr:fungal-specific transcription factor domain-containing protein [Pseudomassariella vexata]ORY63129.1 fungal-specific transcription factor domain-domain-containing protein [Pseudomassariella vexata]